MLDLVEKLGSLLIERGIMLATAESCTGGLIAATITHKPGSSKFFERGFVTYSNESKHDLLNVPLETIKEYGAVSGEVAVSMARGALKNSLANLSVSVTGIAGPDGGTDEKPVGLVYFGYALRGGSSGSLKHIFEGDRKTIQTKAVVKALKHLIEVMSDDETFA